jgi:hypothetical protein
MKPILSSAALLALVPAMARAQIQLMPHTTLTFAAAAEGRKILIARDDYIQRLSPFDRQARLKTDKPVSEQEFLDFIARNVRGWSDAEREKVAAAFGAVQPRLAKMNLPFPEKIALLRTTGNEEGQMPYTRGAALVFPTGRLASAGDAELQSIICHELFHVLSRANPKLKEALYGAIGFQHCGEVELPPALRDRKITNPDAPRNDHCIRLKIEGQERLAVPILYSSAATYDRQRGGEFFEYLEFRFMPIRIDEDKPRADADENGLADPAGVSGFYEQIGRNTRYIIHPEEILADNFAMLVLGASQPQSPDVLRKIEETLKQFAQKEQAASP